MPSTPQRLHRCTGSALRFPLVRYSGAASVREILTGDVWGRRDDEYQDVIDNPEYKPMLVIAVIKPHNPSLEAPVLTGRRLSFNPRR